MRHGAWAWSSIAAFLFAWSVCGAASEGVNNISSYEAACLQKGLVSLALSCDNLQPDRSALQLNRTTPRIATAALLQACVDTGASVRPLRIVSPPFTITTSLKSVSNNVFSRVSGVPVQFDLLDVNAYFAARGPMIADTNPPNATFGYDGIVVSTSTLSDAALVPGKIIDISQTIATDPSLKWWGIKPTLREAVTMYGNKVAGIPLYIIVQFLYYHREVFERDNLTVPQTWEEMIELGERYNNIDTDGDGKPDFYGICIRAGCGVESMIMRAIFASYVQTHGHTQGMWWDAETLQPLVASAAMAEALKVLRRMRAAGPKVLGIPGLCPTEVPQYVQGRCLLSISDAQELKVSMFGAAFNYPNSTVMKGKLGVAPMPGSAQVLDRATGTLEYCTKERCPLAQGSSNLKGRGLVPINRPILTSAWLIMLNGLSPPTYQYYALSIMAYLSSADVLGTNGLLLQRNEARPMHDVDMQESNVPAWVARNYSASDVSQWLAAWRDSTASENINVDPKFPGTAKLIAALGSAGATVMNLTLNVSINAILANYTAVLDDIVALNGGWGKFTDVYRSSLNWKRDVPPPPPPSAGGVKHISSGVIAAIAAPTALAVLGTVLALWLYRRYYGGREGLQRLLAPPGQGPDTTLLVTDIQDSTLLWEHPDSSAEMMDGCLQLHHKCIRGLFTEHRAYESATEGDSFLLAFHCPEDAVSFAMAAQQALLSLPWPKGLLNMAGSFGMPCEYDPVAEVCALHSRAPHSTKASPAAAAVQHLARSANSTSVRRSASASDAIAVDESGRSKAQGAKEPAAEISGADNADCTAIGLTGGALAAAADDAGAKSAFGAARPVGAVGMTFGQWLGGQWTVVDASGAGAVLAGGGRKDGGKMVVPYRGLRVRMGLHTGVPSATDVSRNAASTRVVFSGMPLQLAKAVGDAGLGGMVVLSEATLGRLPEGFLNEMQLILLWRGLHVIKEDLPAVHLYEVCAPQLLARVALVQRPLRIKRTVMEGVLQAPVRAGAVARIYVVGAEILLAWNQQVASEAFEVLHSHLLQQLRTFDGRCAIAEGAAGLGGRDPCAAPRAPAVAMARRASYRVPTELARSSYGSSISTVIESQSQDSAQSVIGGAKPSMLSRANFSESQLQGSSPSAGALAPAGGGGAEEEAGEDRKAAKARKKGRKEGEAQRSRPGVMTVVFSDAAAAAEWALSSVQRMPYLKWPLDLMSHELCEPIIVMEDCAGAAQQSPLAAAGDAAATPAGDGRDGGAVDNPKVARLKGLSRPIVQALAGGTDSPQGASSATARGAEGSDGEALGSPRDGRSSSTAAAASPLSAAASIRKEAALGGPPQEADAASETADSVDRTSPNGSEDGEIMRTMSQEDNGRADDRALPLEQNAGPVLAFCGLRARCAVASGDLRGELVPGSSTGLLTYRGRAWKQLDKLLKGARAGQVVSTQEVANTLPAQVRAHVIVAAQKQR